ncbi:hypothetical protein N7510_000076 [Penicillium lagena]|uniref:uncharacterized protein n=1 Tax=Penicillium lagena TaxID=94218 RepID=UPI002541A00D|nr:uncharacterized protein N7510_000076 [Penicillium lagena]KAJ5623767.1 hypothetical protein N7510_000076 [Penicillium lagena]
MFGRFYAGTHSQQRHHRRGHDAQQFQDADIHWVNVSFSAGDVMMPDWDLFEVAKLAIRGGRASISSRPTMHGCSLMYSIKVEGTFTHRDDILTAADALICGYQREIDQGRGPGLFPRSCVFSGIPPY